MQKEITCGNKCLKYIFENYGILDKEFLKKDRIWIADLGLELIDKNFSIDIMCNNSNLFEEYNSAEVDLEFEGFRYIRELENKGIKIENKKLTQEELLDEIKKTSFMILCVESKIFNNDSRMNGGHYIILNNYVDGKINIINPTKEKYEYKSMNINDLIKCCKNFGEWRILIKEIKNG